MVNVDDHQYIHLFIDTGKWKVSAKIQQLLNTLKRPKRRPLPDFYIDDETDLESEFGIFISVNFSHNCWAGFNCLKSILIFYI